MIFEVGNFEEDIFFFQKVSYPRCLHGPDEIQKAF